MNPDNHFRTELEIFRKEEETAQQYFFAWLQIRSEFGRDAQLLDRANDTPMFWITMHHALLLSAFVALGRIFDQTSRHNVDALLRKAKLDLFTQRALKARRIRDGMDEALAEQYVSGKYEATPDDFRRIRAEVNDRRNLYDACFKDVRNKIFAHKEIADDLDKLNEVMGKAKIDDLQQVFGFLHALHEALWELYTNGRRPILCLPYFETRVECESLDTSWVPGNVVAREVAQFFSAFKSAYKNS